MICDSEDAGAEYGKIIPEAIIHTPQDGDYLTFYCLSELPLNWYADYAVGGVDYVKTFSHLKNQSMLLKLGFITWHSQYTVYCNGVDDKGQSFTASSVVFVAGNITLVVD